MKKNLSDIVLIPWIVVVAVAYYGPIAVPEIARYSDIFAKIYALMIVISVLTIALRYLRRAKPEPNNAVAERKGGK